VHRRVTMSLGGLGAVVAAALVALPATADEWRFSLSFEANERAPITAGAPGEANARALQRIGDAVAAPLPLAGMELVLVAGDDDLRLAFDRAQGLGDSVARRTGNPMLARHSVWRTFLLRSEIGSRGHLPPDPAGRQTLHVRLRPRPADDVPARAAPRPCAYALRFDDPRWPPLLGRVPLPDRVALGPAARVWIEAFPATGERPRAVWRHGQGNRLSNGRAALTPGGTLLAGLPAILHLVSSDGRHPALALADRLGETPAPAPDLARHLGGRAGANAASTMSRQLGDAIAPLPSGAAIAPPPARLAECIVHFTAASPSSR
jgi:hypothetical protein